jgi:Arc/MetJ-type ribon-helix-helix transcriptional regulator
MKTVVELEGAVELTLKKLINLGFFKTKNEAIRAGLLGLGKEYKVNLTSQEIEDELVVRKMMKISKEVKAGKRKMVSLDAVLKENKIKRSELE